MDADVLIFRATRSRDQTISKVRCMRTSVSHRRLYLEVGLRLISVCGGWLSCMIIPAVRKGSQISFTSYMRKLTFQNGEQFFFLLLI